MSTGIPGRSGWSRSLPAIPGLTRDLRCQAAPVRRRPWRPAERLPGRRRPRPRQRSRTCWRSAVPWRRRATWPSPCPPATAGRAPGGCRCCCSSSAATTTSTCATPPASATDAHRRTRHPADPRPLAAPAPGRSPAGIAITEQHGGSQVHATATRATRAGDGTWRVTGTKTWISRLTEAAVFCVFFTAPAGQLTAAVIDARRRRPVPPADHPGGPVRLGLGRTAPRRRDRPALRHPRPARRGNAAAARPLRPLPAPGRRNRARRRSRRPRPDRPARQPPPGRTYPRVRDNALITLGRTWAQLNAALLAAVTAHPRPGRALRRPTGAAAQGPCGRDRLPGGIRTRAAPGGRGFTAGSRPPGPRRSQRPAVRRRHPRQPLPSRRPRPDHRTARVAQPRRVRKRGCRVLRARTVPRSVTASRHDADPAGKKRRHPPATSSRRRTRSPRAHRPRPDLFEFSSSVKIPPS